jgi:sulfur relay (sulfurtransferase) DsrF/TusC family protein
VNKIAIILRKPPYGDINAAEAVRHALGAAGDEMEVSLILFDGGTLLAKSGQQEEGTGFTNLGSALADCIEMGVAVYAERASLRQEFLETGDLIEGVRVINGTEAGELIKASDRTMIF